MRILMFHREAKMYENRQKQTKKNYSVNPPYSWSSTLKLHSVKVRNQYDTLFKTNYLATISKHKIIDFLSKILTFGKVRIAQPRSHWANSLFNQ